MQSRGAHAAFAAQLSSLMREPQVVARLRRHLGNPSQPGQSVGVGKGTGATSARQARSGRVLTESKKRKRKKKETLSTKGRLKALEKKVNTNLDVIYSTITTRAIEFEQIFTPGNGVTYSSFSCGSLNSYANTAAALTQQDDGVFSGVMDLDLRAASDGLPMKFSRKVTFRNNECVPLKATFYEVQVKQDTDRTPQQLIDNGMSNSGIVASAENRLGWTPHSAKLFNQFYTIVQTESVYMQPGDEYSQTVTTGWNTYNPGWLGGIDTGSVSYSKRWNTRFIMVRLEGVVVHDSTAVPVQIGLSSAYLDTVSKAYLSVKIPDEGNLRTLKNTGTLGAVVKYQFCGPNNPEVTEL